MFGFSIIGEFNYGCHIFLGRLIEAGEGEGSVGSLLRAVFLCVVGETT